VGVASSVVAASTTATAAAGSVTALATPSLALLAAKWIAVGMLGGLTLAGTASVFSDVASPRATPATTHAVRQGTVTRPNEPAEPTATPRRDVPPTRSDIQSRSWPAAAAPAKPAGVTKSAAPIEKPATIVAPASASLPAGQSLSQEIALIDGARRSLGAGDASGALQKLEDYAARLRTGTLDREAHLLRIDALSQAGQRAAALSLAKRYLESYPNDPHAPRLRALLIVP
jgi:hypothetical protein